MSAADDKEGSEVGPKARRTDPRVRDARLLPKEALRGRPRKSAIVDCGWGRLLFGQTFDDVHALVAELTQEKPDQRDIAVYVQDPHVAVRLAPDRIFLDPSHIYRLWLQHYRPSRETPPGFIVRQAQGDDEAAAINRVYARCGMVETTQAFLRQAAPSRLVTVFVAEEAGTGAILGVVMGVDHVRAFEDPENGSSLWSLAVDPGSSAPRVGEMLTRRLAEHFQARSRAFMDLSVMHDNAAAIALYERLGFQRAHTFTLKYKNPLNESLYIAEAPSGELNPYATIIIDEARRRGIVVDILDEQANVFELAHGARRIRCRESLSDLTSGVASETCRDKALTMRLLRKAGLETPEQVDDVDEAVTLLSRCGSVVVKPADGEGGAGVAVDLRSEGELVAAISQARAISSRVLVETFHPGKDLRIVVIGEEAVACAVRKPPTIRGDGRTHMRALIERQSRRRAAATQGESRIPIDTETERCLGAQGYSLDDVPALGAEVLVRRTANLHTGGVLHDVTDDVHEDLKEAALKAARTLDIPVAGVDLLAPDVTKSDYVIIEVNERPGLANHEPRPTASKFIDLLFPLTVRRR